MRQSGAVSETPVRNRQARSLALYDVAVVLLLTASTFIVHDVPYMLGHPFWLDEAWVAVSTRAPFGLVSWLSSSTPLGWTVLLRAVPGGGQQDLRLLTLLFAALAVVLAYFFGRDLGVHRFLGGLVCGVAVLLLPAMLVRDDLKQYTAEACVSVAAMWLVVLIENRYTRGKLVALGVLTAGGLFIANSAIFVGTAALVALAAEALIRRNRRHLLEIGATFTAALVTGFGIYALVDRRHVSSGLVSYWDAYYVPHNNGVSGATSFLHVRAGELAPYLGSRFLLVDVVIAFVGVGVLICLKRYALAAVVPITIVLVIGASADRRYPFGDLRTSTFWLVMVGLLMAVAAVGAATAAGTLASRIPAVAVTAPAVVVAAALAAYAVSVHGFVRAHSIPDEDVRSQVAYVEAHDRPADAVVVDFAASYGFAYYSDDVEVGFRHTKVAAVGFQPAFPRQPRIITMPDRQAADVADALTAATRALGPGGRIWIVRSHVGAVEAAAWSANLAGKDVTTIPVGPEPLLLVAD